MTNSSKNGNHALELLDEEPELEVIRREVLDGLTKRPKTLPPWLLYDERGAELFEEICELDEYYVTRTEMEIMSSHVQEMADHLGPRCMLVELGSGASVKTRLLLEHMQSPTAYIPVDIAKEQLAETAASLSQDFPKLDVAPVCADFTEDFTLPMEVDEEDRTVVYFPGSTIGNFHPAEAAELLKKTAELCGPKGGLLIGVDLLKPRDVLERAYNDRQGVTAAFNLNLLSRLNRELDADFDPSSFRHKAIFNEARSRVEMHLESICAQRVGVDEVDVEFQEGESIHTECSYKYRVEQFAGLARRSGWAVDSIWTDRREYFSIQYLTTEV